MSGGLSGPASMGVYTNQMSYLINENMAFYSQLHFVQPGIVGLNQMGQPNMQMYYQTALHWQLSNSINLRVGFSNMPYTRRYSPFGRSLYRPYEAAGGFEYAPSMDW